MTRRRLFTWRKALVWGRGSVAATRRADPMARLCYPGVSTIRPPGTKGERPDGRRARKRGIPKRPGQRLEHSGQLTERDPLPRQKRPDTGPSTVGPSGARAWPEQVPKGLPTPPGLGSSPRRPPARGTDQARRLPPRRAQREPDSGRGLPPVPPAPPAPLPPHVVPVQRTSPAESAALTSPARGAPSAAAGARPVPAAPAAAPARAPRPRKRF